MWPLGLDQKLTTNSPLPHHRPVDHSRSLVCSTCTTWPPTTPTTPTTHHTHPPTTPTTSTHHANTRGELTTTPPPVHSQPTMSTTGVCMHPEAIDADGKCCVGVHTPRPVKGCGCALCRDIVNNLLFSFDSDVEQHDDPAAPTAGGAAATIDPGPDADGSDCPSPVYHPTDPSYDPRATDPASDAAAAAGATQPENPPGPDRARPDRGAQGAATAAAPTAGARAAGASEPDHHARPEHGAQAAATGAAGAAVRPGPDHATSPAHAAGPARAATPAATPVELRAAAAKNAAAGAWGEERATCREVLRTAQLQKEAEARAATLIDTSVAADDDADVAATHAEEAVRELHWAQERAALARQGLAAAQGRADTAKRTAAEHRAVADQALVHAREAADHSSGARDAHQLKEQAAVELQLDADRAVYDLVFCDSDGPSCSPSSSSDRDATCEPRTPSPPRFRSPRPTAGAERRAAERRAAGKRRAPTPTSSSDDDMPVAKRRARMRKTRTDMRRDAHDRRPTPCPWAERWILADSPPHSPTDLARAKIF